MISRFFIDRPIFAAVLSIFITLTGAIALVSMPIAQYPPVTPPAVSVTITYPGASAQVMADTVAAPIEQQVNGVEGMLYMASQMGNDGSYTLTVTFDIGTDLNMALVMVQNRVQLAEPLLPTSVQAQGITIRKKTPDILNIINFYSPDGRYDALYLSNFAQIHVYDELLRIDGVSQINFVGVGNYSIRAWLDPQKLASLNMTASDVANALSAQNLDTPLGVLAQQPAPRTQAFELPINALGRLTTTEQFGDIIVKTGLGQSSSRSNGPVALAPTSSGLTGASGTSSSGTALASTTYGSSATPTLGSATTSASGMTGTSGTTSGSSSSPTSANTGSTSAPTSGATGTTSGSTGTSGTTGTATSGTTTVGGAQTTGGAATAGAALTAGGASTNLSGASSASSSSGQSSSSSSSTGSSSAGSGQPAVAIVRLRDVARLELGDQNYSLACTFDGRPSVGLAVFQLPGTNALDVGNRIRAKMEELKETFPEGVEYQIAYDTTPFIRESVRDVVRTLLEAVVLVGIVVLVFLQSWRATLIPMIAVPVAIVGTFAVMEAIGFSLNNVSLFGLVLAIGIVVDDAIVVVENVERWLERGESSREAARKAMDEVTGPVIAVALVLWRRVRPVRLHQRHHWPVLPAVRRDHRRLDSDFGLQLADTQSRFGGDPVAAARRSPGPCHLAIGHTPGLVLPGIQPGLRRDHNRLRLGGGPAVARQFVGPASLRRPAGSDRVGLSQGAHRLRAGAGPGSDHLQHPAPRLRFAGTDQRSDFPHRGDRPPDKGCGPHDHDFGHFLCVAGRQPKLRFDVRGPGAVRTAEQP